MLPICIAAGCSYEEFWYGDPWIARAYLDAYNIRNKSKNEELWLQGRYVFDAIMCAIQNIHLDGRPHKVVSYNEKPYDFDKRKDEPMTEQEIEQGRKDVAAQLEAWMAAVNKKYEGQNNG